MQRDAERYLARLDRALRRMRVPLRAEALADATEFLAEECAHTEPTFADLIATYGPPSAVARSYRELARETNTRFAQAWYRHAPGWHLTCTACGRTGELQRNAPIAIRIGAWSLGKFIPGWCTECRFLRVLRVWQARTGD